MMLNKTSKPEAEFLPNRILVQINTIMSAARTYREGTLYRILPFGPIQGGSGERDSGYVYITEVYILMIKRKELV